MKYNQNLLMLLVACSLSLHLSAQRFYVTTGDRLGKVSLSPSGCTFTNISPCSDEGYFSITLFRNKLYYVLGTDVHESTLVKGKLTGCKQISELPIPGPTSLTVDSKGALYFAQEYTLFSYDPATKTHRTFGIMPFHSAGDLLFFEGSLYMASSDGIVRVDTSDLAKSTLEVPVFGGLYGLASLSTDCNENKMYAFSTGRGGPTDVIEIDLVNKRAVGVVCTIEGEVYDAASDTEAGGFLGIEINRIDISSMCDKTSFGQMVVVPEPTLTRYSYSLDGGTPSLNPRLINVSPGRHTITITTPGGCRIDTTVLVPVYNSSWPAIKGFKEDVSCIGGRVWFTMPINDPGYWIEYNKDTFAIKHSFEELHKGDHVFKIHDQFNCPVDSQKIHLLQLKTCDTLYFPNAFTPDGDGRNDIFKASQNLFVQTYAVSVYNRWGQLLFKTDDITKGWTGGQSGKRAPPGVYIWMASYSTATGGKKTAKGTVVLIR